MKRLIPAFGMSMALSACSNVDPNPMRDYLGMAPAQSVSINNPRIKNFVDLYNKLEVIPIKAHVTNTYADKLYFNDTLVTLKDRQSLQDYLEQTRDNLDSIEFQILSVFEQDDDVFLRWKMRTRFDMLGQSKDIETIGFSHLRFNEQGLIVLHQDFWDSSQGFFLHLPLIGGILQWIKNGLHN